MKNTVAKFPISYKILIFYIILKIYQISILPLRDFLKSTEFYLDTIILIIFFILVLDYSNVLKSNEYYTNKNYLPIIILFLLFLFSSFYINLEYNLKVSTIFKLIAIVLLFYCFFLKFAKQIYENEILFNKFINGIIAVSVFLSVTGVFINAIGINSSPIITQAYRGLFMHPNTFAFLFCFGIPAVFYKFFSNQISKFKFYSIVSFFLIVLFFTFSRAGFMAALVCIFVFIFFRSRLLSITLVIIFLIIFSTFFTEIQGLKTDSTLARGILYITAFNLITDNSTNMYWGYGIDRSIEIFTDSKMLYGNFESAVNNPHNFLLLLSLQFGILLAFTYLLFIVILLIKSMLKIKIVGENDLKWKIVTCISIISGLLIQNLFEELMVIPEFPVMSLSLIFMGYLFYFISDKTFMLQKNLKN